MTNVRRIYVAPEFEKRLKIMAVEKNKSLLGLTEELAKEPEIDFSAWKPSNKRNIFRL